MCSRRSISSVTSYSWPRSVRRPSPTPLTPCCSSRWVSLAKMRRADGVCMYEWIGRLYVSFPYVGIISSVSLKPNPTFLSSLTHNWSKVSSTCMLLYLLFVVRTLLVDQRFPCCSHCHNVLYSVIRRGCASRHCAVIRYLCSARVVWGGVGCPHSVVQQTSFPCPEPVEISLYAPSDDWLLCNIMYKNM